MFQAHNFSFSVSGCKTVEETGRIHSTLDGIAKSNCISIFMYLF